MAEGQDFDTQLGEEWSFNCDAVITSAATSIKLTKWAKEVWPAGTPVERDIDNCWFPAVIVALSHEGSFSIRFVDDDNEERGVDVDELRAALPDGTYEYVSKEMVSDAAAKLPRPVGSRGSAAGGEGYAGELDLAAWEASETGSEGSRPQTVSSSQGSEGSDWVVVPADSQVPGPPPPDHEHRRSRPRGVKHMGDSNAAGEVASGSGLRALRALRRSKVEAPAGA